MAKIMTPYESIIRVVKVDRTKIPQEMISATGRTKWYIDEEVLAEMPREGSAECVVEIFKLDHDTSIDQLDLEYETGNRAQDPYAVIQVLIDDPSIADEYPIAVQWRDKRGRACYAVFGRYGAERKVSVNRSDSWWLRGDRFGGVRETS